MHEQNGVNCYGPDEMTNEMYHEDTSHVSGSGLWELYDTTPAHYHANLGSHKQTPAKAFGTATHCAILEPARYHEKYAEEFDHGANGDALDSCPEIRSALSRKGLKTTGQKAAIVDRYREARDDGDPLLMADLKQEHEILNEGRTILKADDSKKVSAMASKLHTECPTIATWNKDDSTLFEHSFFTEIDGCPIKVRPDIVSLNHCRVCEYKTDKSLSLDRFMINASNHYGYFLKSALVVRVLEKYFGRELDGYSFLLQEKGDPYEFKTIPLTIPYLKLGDRQATRAMETYKECVESGIFPGYDRTEIEMPVMTWLFEKHDALDALEGEFEL